MTYALYIGGDKRLIVSDSRFKYCRKKPTLSIYDKATNIETKIASFNNQETFEWFLKEIIGIDRIGKEI